MRAENQESFPLINEQETREGVLFLKPRMSLHQFLLFLKVFDILADLSPALHPSLLGCSPKITCQWKFAHTVK